MFKRDALTKGLIDEEKYALSGTEILTVPSGSWIHVRGGAYRPKAQVVRLSHKWKKTA